MNYLSRLSAFITPIKIGITAVLVLSLIIINGFNHAAASDFPAGTRISLIDIVNVREPAGLAEPILGANASGSVGTVLDIAPVTVDGYTWIPVDFDAGFDGWIVQDFAVLDGSAPDPVAQQKVIHNYIFGHSLINHEAVSNQPLTPELAVPNWIHRFAVEAGHEYAVDGQYGFMQKHVNELPPDYHWSFDEAPNIAQRWGSDPFADQEYNTVLMTPLNYVQHLAPDAPYYNEATSSPLSYTIDLIDYLEQEEPGTAMYIYLNWPDLDPSGPTQNWNINGFPATTSEMAAYHTGVMSDDWLGWWDTYFQSVTTARPNADIKMIPVAPLMSDVLLNVLNNQITSAELYEDDAPHGRPTTYFLASLVTYMAMYGEAAPTTYTIPDTVHPLVRNNFQTIVDYMWAELAPEFGGDEAPDPVPVDTTDTDGDGVLDTADNCVDDANADQADNDNDGIGNVCDTTPDGDVDPDPEPTGDFNIITDTAGPDNLVGTDGDDYFVLTGAGKKWRWDVTSGLGGTDYVEMPTSIANFTTADANANAYVFRTGTDFGNIFPGTTVEYLVFPEGTITQDEAVDVINNGAPFPGGVDPEPGPTDSDFDGVPDSEDNCVDVQNADQFDNDNDGIGNQCDPTPDGDPVPTDTDGDGVADTADNCVDDANADQADNDNDGIGNVCDTTPDGDVDPDPEPTGDFNIITDTAGPNTLAGTAGDDYFILTGAGKKWSWDVVNGLDGTDYVEMPTSIANFTTADANAGSYIFRTGTNIGNVFPGVTTEYLVFPEGTYTVVEAAAIVNGG